MTGVQTCALPISKGRYRSANKRYERFDALVTDPNREDDAVTGNSPECVVYCYGMLYGELLSGETYDNIRFIDRFSVRDGKLIDQMVWNDMAEVLARYGDRYAIQGNFDPDLMLLPAAELEPLIRDFLGRMRALPAAQRRGWICGLGHGVLQRTPEANVRLFLRLQRELFA